VVFDNPVRQRTLFAINRPMINGSINVSSTRKPVESERIWPGVRTVIVEDATRFARDLVTQELIVLALIGRGVRVLTISPTQTTPSRAPCARLPEPSRNWRRPASSVS
jgi:hypothetical protein